MRANHNPLRASSPLRALRVNYGNGETIERDGEAGAGVPVFQLDCGGGQLIQRIVRQRSFKVT
jgi:hypothetical protein